MSDLPLLRERHELGCATVRDIDPSYGCTCDEPLTRERARAWLEEESARLEKMFCMERTADDLLRRSLLRTACSLDALADLLVDAAAGRVR